MQIVDIRDIHGQYRRNFNRLQEKRQSTTRLAYGSVCELETQVLLSGDLNYVDKENLVALKANTEEVERMLKALIKSLVNKHLDP